MHYLQIIRLTANELLTYTDKNSRPFNSDQMENQMIYNVYLCLDKQFSNFTIDFNSIRVPLHFSINIMNSNYKQYPIPIRSIWSDSVLVYFQVGREAFDPDIDNVEEFTLIKSKVIGPRNPADSPVNTRHNTLNTLVSDKLFDVYWFQNQITTFE